MSETYLWKRAASTVRRHDVNMNGADRARCHRCGGDNFERVEDTSARGAVTDGFFFGTVVRLEYRCTACGELTKLIPPGRDERYPTRG